MRLVLCEKWAEIAGAPEAKSSRNIAGSHAPESSTKNAFGSASSYGKIVLKWKSVFLRRATRKDEDRVEKK